MILWLKKERIPVDHILQKRQTIAGVRCWPLWAGLAALCFICGFSGCSKAFTRESSKEETREALALARFHAWVTRSDDAVRYGMMALVQSGKPAPEDFQIHGVPFKDYESRVHLDVSGRDRVAVVEFRHPSQVAQWPESAQTAPDVPGYLRILIQIDPKTGKALGLYGIR